MEGKGLIKYSIMSVIIGFLPIFIIFIQYFFNSTSPVILTLFDIAKGHARNYSEYHFMISTIASAYTKTAPIFAIAMFLLCWHKLDIHTVNLNMKKWLQLLPLLIILTIGIYSLLYIGEDNLSVSSWRIIRIISESKFLLMLYYIGVFLTNYFFMWLFIFYFYPLKVFSSSRKRE